MTDSPGPAEPAGPPLEIGVVLDAFLDWPLDRVLSWLRAAAPEITAIEVGAGGSAAWRRPGGRDGGLPAV